MQVLLERICWSTSAITFFTAPITPFVSDFVMTLQSSWRHQNVPLTSTHENELAIAEVVKDVIRMNTTLHQFLANHSDALPDCPTIEEAVNYIVGSVRVAGLNAMVPGEPVTFFNIFAISPSNDAATYENWILQLRNITYFSQWGTLTAKEPFSCNCCKSTDHPEVLCPFKAIPSFPVPPTSDLCSVDGKDAPKGLDTDVKQARLMNVVGLFTPNLPDELHIKIGETVRIIKEYKDGWCYVEFLGRRDAPKGVVPLVCLQERLVRPMQNASNWGRNLHYLTMRTTDNTD
ncbi:hypothetical protein BYT27DRAFT_6901800 [Phlegmacium glaucopus]|nr:hypothetical protein BYT27DRAFT_6901800 [Phlegmacium glaucopus]